MMTFDELRLAMRPVEEVAKGDTFSLRVDEKVRPNDKLYKITSA